MMTKIFYTVLFSFILSTTAYSQLGIKGGFALGDRINPSQGLHLGFNLGVTYDITESIRGEVLFEGLFRKETHSFFGNSNYKINYHVLPITVGADYRFLKGKIQPYAGLNLGVISFAANSNGSSYYGRSYFGFYPKAGVDFEITDNLLIDLTVKYYVAFDSKGLNNHTNTQILGGNIGLIYVFN